MECENDYCIIDFLVPRAEIKLSVPVPVRLPDRGKRRVFMKPSERRAAPSAGIKSKKTLSLPTRLSIAVMTVLVFTTLAADVMAVRELRMTLSRSVSTSLSGMVGRLAGQLDEDLAALTALAAEEAALVGGLEPERVEEALRRRASALGFAFDYGVLVIDRNGKVTADSLERDWSGGALDEYEFFQRTFALARPLVSEPFASPLDGRAVVMVTAPLTDGEGRMRGMVAAGMDAGRNRTLNLPVGMRAGRFGQIGIFTRDGTVVAHSQRELLLKGFENPLPESPPRDGVLEIRVADGEKALLAVADLRNADWLVAGVFSSKAVYAPIERGFLRAQLWFAAGLAACAVLAWLIAGRGVRDLGLLAREVEGIGRDGEWGVTRVGESYRGEAGELAGAVNAMLASLETARREVEELSAREGESVERERRSIAADLHDSVCQSLALANMRLGGLRKRVAADADAARTVEEVRGIVDEAVKEVRSLTFSLNPGVLYELGLVPALEWYAGDFGRRYGLPVEVEAGEEPPALSETAAAFAYRSARELLANVAKHAGAKTVRIRVDADGGELLLRVEDDGGGFAPGVDDRSDGGGFGLRHIRQGAKRLGGTFSTRAGADGGTVAELRIPLSGVGK